MPNATARCVLLTPGGPNKSTFSPSAMNRPLASSLITFGSIDGWNFQSKLSSVFWNGKRAIITRIAWCFSCLAATSRASTSSRKSA